MCRLVKLIEAPIKICIKCLPAMKILRSVLHRKDAEIAELNRKLKKFESETKDLEELKHQVNGQKQEIVDCHIKIGVYSDDIELLRKELEKTQNELDNLK